LFHAFPAMKSLLVIPYFGLLCGYAFVKQFCGQIEHIFGFIK
jgi:hypothetical protein